VVSLLLAGGANIEATDEVRRRWGSGKNDAFPGGRSKMDEFHIFLLYALLRRSPIL